MPEGLCQLADNRPDEPMFVLLGRDRLAGHLVSIWSKVRMGDMEAASAVFLDMMHKHAVAYGLEPDVAKAIEAMDCSLAMFRFREAREEARRMEPHPDAEHAPQARDVL